MISCSEYPGVNFRQLNEIFWLRGPQSNEPDWLSCSAGKTCLPGEEFFSLKEGSGPNTDCRFRLCSEQSPVNAAPQKKSRGRLQAKADSVTRTHTARGRLFQVGEAPAGLSDDKATPDFAKCVALPTRRFGMSSPGGQESPRSDRQRSTI